MDRLVLLGVGNADPIVDYITWNGESGAKVRGSTNFPLHASPQQVPGWPLL